LLLSNIKESFAEAKGLSVKTTLPTLFFKDCGERERGRQKIDIDRGGGGRTKISIRNL
jgi:hypothetical protein